METFGITSDKTYTGKYNIIKDKFWERLNLSEEIKSAFNGEINNLQNIIIDLQKFRTGIDSYKTGEQVFNLTMFPFYNSKGKINYVISLWKGETKFQNTENQLNLLTAALESAANGIVITDKKGDIIWTNKAFISLTGYSENELLGKNPRILKSGIQAKEFYEKLWNTILEGKTWHGEIINKRKDGSYYNEFQTITPVKNSEGEIENFIAIKIDISERIKSEYELKKLNRALETISACNSILIHSIDEKGLLDKICKVIIEIGGYRFNFIGMIENQYSKSISIASKYGHEDRYLEINKESLQHKIGIRSPLFKAIQSKQIQVVNDISEDKDFAIWKDEALKRGYRSVIILPLVFNEIVLGILNIYSDVINTFDLAEIDLLKELAGDISFGINSIRAEEKRKAAEHELAKSEEQYRRFFQQDLAGNFISTPDGKILKCNPAFLQIFGLKSTEDAKNIDANVFYSSQEERKKFLDEIKSKKRLMGIERKFITFKGEMVHCAENVWGDFDKDGNLLQIQGYLFDITQRKNAEMELRESVLKYQELVENINDVFFIMDLQGNLSYISPAVKLLTGFDPEEIIGSNFIEYVHEVDRTKVINDFKNVLNGIINPDDYNIRTKSGEIKWVHTSSRPYVRNGKTVGVQGVLVDITQIKTTEMELEKAKEKAEESDRLKSAFLAQMSHEIRTPLNVILSYNNLIKDEFQDNISNEWSNIFDLTEIAGRRLMRTIDLILNMSMIQTGNVEVNKSNFNLSNLIQNLYNEFKRLADMKEIKLEFINNIDNAIIESDEYIFSKILENLIDNAIKYTNNGKVEIILNDVKNKSFTVDILDTGIGISEEYLPNLFAPFSQEDIGYSRKFEGNGLGLALVKHYADLLNVKLKVESKKGKGTKFSISIKK